MNSEILFILSIALLTIIVLLTISNLVAVMVAYYLLRHEIDEIDDDNLKVELLYNLNSIWVVFTTRLLFHKEKYFFSNRKVYSKLIHHRISASCMRTTVENPENFRKEPVRSETIVQDL